MQVIAVANQKGGCGKTTTAINLSSSLVIKGKKVLLIDCDPQSHATMGLNVDAAESGSLYNVLTTRTAEQLSIEDVAVEIKDNFDIVPSDALLSAIEQEFADLDSRESSLLRALGRLSKNYDYVVLDCPPSIGHLCINCLRACNIALIPIDMSLFSLRGVARLTDILAMLRNAVGHQVDCRALITMYDSRTRYSRQVLEKVREQFRTNVFETVIRYNIRLRETVDYGVPVSDYDHLAIGHYDYSMLAEEILCSVSSTPKGMIHNSVQGYIQNVSDRISTQDHSLDSIDDPLFDTEVSSYSQMVDDMVSVNSDFFEEYEDELDPY